MTDSASPTAASDHDPNTVLLLQLLDHCVAEKASDLHLSADHPPYLRLQGLLAPLADQATLSPTTLRGMANYLCQGCNVQALEETGALDGALSTADGTRFRYNVYRRGGEFSIALRRLEETIRQLSDLGLSDDLYQLAELRDGLVLLAGPTGCGKSTTLATLIAVTTLTNLIKKSVQNRQHCRFIICIVKPSIFSIYLCECIMHRKNIRHTSIFC